MARLFLQLIKKKLPSLNKFPPSNNDKTLNSPFLFPYSPTKILEKIPPTKKSCLNGPPSPLKKGRGRKLCTFFLIMRLNISIVLSVICLL